MKTCSSLVRFVKILLITILVSFTGMSAYEVLKQVVYPDVPIWTSHFITIIFGTLVSTIAVAVTYYKLEHINSLLFKEVCERRSAEAELRENTAYLEAAQRMSHVGHWSMVLSTGEMECSCELYRILGLDPGRRMVPGELLNSFISPEDADRVKRLMDSTITSNDPLCFDCRAVMPDGSEKTVHCEGGLIYDESGNPVRIFAIVQDITAHALSREKILASLRDKEALLKEVHHRVKNNLQVVSSLISLQSCKVEDERVIQTFNECQNRIRSMALIHEMTYRSRDISGIDISEYIPRLINNLAGSYGLDMRKVLITISADNVSLDMDRIILVGLIINELVSNSIKYAFPGDKEGEITILVSRCPDENICLVVSDNGVGLPAGFSLETTDSLGMQLVQSFTEQLGGTMLVENARGTRVSIRFRLS